MKKITFCFSFLIALFSVHELSAQRPPTITDIFCEDFDAQNFMWSMAIDSFPSANDSSWVRDTIITAEPTSFGSARIQVGRVNSTPNAAGYRSGDRITSPVMYIDTFISVALSFDHLCYLANADAGTVEYSFDGGLTWEKIPESNRNFNGVLYDRSIPGIPGPPDYRFSKGSDAARWQFGSNSFVWTRLNSANAWSRENFDLTTLIDARNPKPDSLRIRFAAYDPGNSPVGPEGDHFWWIDNFCVTGGDCDLVPPEMDFLPPTNYPGVDKYDERVYLSGPWIFDADVTDNKGVVSEVYVAYWLLRENPITFKFDTIFNDTIPMVLQGSSTQYRGRIQALYDPMNSTDVVSAGDSIIWKVEAFDGSACRNGVANPPNGKFQVRPSLPPSCKSNPIFTFPYVEDFNSSDWDASTNGERTMVNGWANVTGDNEDWRIESGESSSEVTPFKIFDDFPGGGKYLKVESGELGNFLNGKLAYLNSPCFDFTELRNGNVRFYLNMNTAGLEDSIRVDIFDPTPVPGSPSGKFVENVIPVVKGAKGNNWLPFEFSILPFRNIVTQVRWAGRAGRPDGLGDMGLDSFKIVAAPELDLRMNDVILKGFTPANFLDPLTVNIQNIGSNPESGFQVFYEVYTLKDSTPVLVPNSRKQELFPGTIQPASGQNFTFTDQYLVPEGRYQIKAWLEHTPDPIQINDTSFATSRGIRKVLGNKYMDDFDGDTIWTTSFRENDTLNNKWELGTPNYDYTYSAYSEPNSWDIELNRAYTGTGGLASLMSPFLDFSTVEDAILSFINNRDIDTTIDGMLIQYSLNRGDSWRVMEALDDTAQIRWNNSNLSSGGFGGLPVISGNTYCFGNTWNGFLESEVRLPPVLNFQPEVLLRFDFFAREDDDGNDGISIDNILVYDPEVKDLQVQHYLSPTSRCDLQPDQRIKSIIKNRGTDTINSFNIRYIVTHLPTSTVYNKVDVINRTIAFRDTLHVLSQSTFDMDDFGDYDVQVIAELPGDLCVKNDTLKKLVENVKGCSLQFYIETSRFPNIQLPCDSSVWKFNYTSGGREYQISQAYNSPKGLINLPFGVTRDTLTDQYVCIKDNSEVTFRLDDKDELIGNYSFIAFNGDRNIVLFDETPGGPDSPVRRFNWNCPPDLSATPIAIHLDNDLVQLPLPKNYDITIDVLNNGLDSLDSVYVYFQIDALPPSMRVMTFPFPNYLRYTQVKAQQFGPQFISEGIHTLRAWTEFPNGQQDELVEDDTIEVSFTAMSTVPFTPISDTLVGSNGEDSVVVRSIICEDFEDPTIRPWISADPYTLSQQDRTLELGTPSTTFIPSANSGSNAWATNLDGPYENGAAGMLISPFFNVSKDSCYLVNFSHNYYINDSLNDGGTVWFLLPDQEDEDYSIDVWSSFGRIAKYKDSIISIDTTYITADTIIGTMNDTILIVADTIIDTVSVTLLKSIEQGLGDTIYDAQKGWYNTKAIASIPDGGIKYKNAGWTGISKGWTTASALLIPTVTYNTALIWRFEADGSGVDDGWAIDDFCVEKLPPTACYPVSVREALFDQDQFYLGQNIPNPATYSTDIPFYLPKSGEVQFEVTNLLGQSIYQENMNRPKGDGIISLDLTNIAKGAYYYTLTVDGNRVTKKMVISK